MNVHSDESASSMREIVQRKFLDDIIGTAAKKSGGWMILVLDDEATRVISSALTMYDIMERKITLVEQLSRPRQPFPEMDVIYLVSSSMESIKEIVADFSTTKAKYANVHIFFLDQVSDAGMALLQKNEVLLDRVQTFVETHLNFLASENNVFQLEYPNSIKRIIGPNPDSNFAFEIANKLSTLCITLNEHPTVRYQASSSFAKTIAVFVQQNLIEYKQRNATHWTYGDETHPEKERGVLVVLDRSFDVLTPLMHEYTYQALAQDLLAIKDNVIPIKVTTNSGEVQNKDTLLNENDDLWVDLRHRHIAQVIKNLSDRMKDVIQNNTGGAALAGGKGGDLTLSSMAAAVKELPEYRQTLAKLNQHVSIAQQCMDTFTKQGIWDISQLEQFMSTGYDSNNTPLKKPALMQELVEVLENPKVTAMQKLRLLAIFCITQKSLATSDERQALIRTAKLGATEQHTLKNVDFISGSFVPASAHQFNKPKGFFTQFFNNTSDGVVAENDSEIADTRHVSSLQAILDKLVALELSVDDYPNIDVSISAANETKNVAKSARRQAGKTRFGGRKEAYSGSRSIIFIAGGVSYAEMRVAYDVMQKNSREVVIGGTHLLTPLSYLEELRDLDTVKAKGITITHDEAYDDVNV